MTFNSPLSIAGRFREPRQMLGEQEYDGHSSIHDDRTAEELGFRAGPIEGPTHFSQFAPLMLEVFGQAFFERGCLSVHYKNMVVEGERVRAFAALPRPGGTKTEIWAEKADGTQVLEGSASLGSEPGDTLLENRLETLRPAENLVILSDLEVGMCGVSEERVRMDPDQSMGKLYPFSLNQKLQKITESSPWYQDANSSPWGRAIIPFEMISVLATHSMREASFPVKGPAIGLFADQQIRLIEGPLFVGEDYILRRQIVALTESRRTESYWVRTGIYDSGGKRMIAEMLLNHATLKHSYEPYERERAALLAE